MPGVRWWWAIAENRILGQSRALAIQVLAQVAHPGVATWRDHPGLLLLVLPPCALPGLNLAATEADRNWQ
jgi:hypothetical protein